MDGDHFCCSEDKGSTNDVPVHGTEEEEGREHNFDNITGVVQECQEANEVFSGYTSSDEFQNVSVTTALPSAEDADICADDKTHGPVDDIKHTNECQNEDTSGDCSVKVLLQKEETIVVGKRTMDNQTYKVTNDNKSKDGYQSHDPEVPEEEEMRDFETCVMNAAGDGKSTDVFPDEVHESEENNKEICTMNKQTDEKADDSKSVCQDQDGDVSEELSGVINNRTYVAADDSKYIHVYQDESFEAKESKYDTCTMNAREDQVDSNTEQTNLCDVKITNNQTFEASQKGIPITDTCSNFEASIIRETSENTIDGDKGISGTTKSYTYATFEEVYDAEHIDESCHKTDTFLDNNSDENSDSKAIDTRHDNTTHQVDNTSEATDVDAPNSGKQYGVSCTDIETVDVAPSAVGCSVIEGNSDEGSLGVYVVKLVSGLADYECFFDDSIGKTAVADNEPIATSNVTETIVSDTESTDADGRDTETVAVVDASCATVDKNNTAADTDTGANFASDAEIVKTITANTERNTVADTEIVARTTDTETVETTTVDTETADTTSPDTETVDTTYPDTGTVDTTSPDTETVETTSPDTETVETTSPDTEAVYTTSPDTGTVDTTSPDTGTVDTTSPDTETVDTTSPDTEAVDTTTPDTETVDTTSPDTETVDTTSPDTGTVDTTSPDTETVDTTSPDTETADTTSPDTETVDTTSPDTDTVDTTSPDTETVDTTSPDTGTVDTTSPDTGTADTTSHDTGTVDTTYPDTETVETTSPDTETVETTSPDTETVETTTVDTGTVDMTSPDTETVEITTSDTETVKTATSDTETVETTTSDTETVKTTIHDTETVETTTSDTQTVETTTADTETVEITTADTETMETTTDDTETVETTTDATETVETTTADTETVEITTINTETVETATSDTETVETTTDDTETVKTTTHDTETVETTTINTETVETATSDTETVETTTADTETVETTTDDTETVKTTTHDTETVETTTANAQTVETTDTERAEIKQERAESTYADTVARQVTATATGTAERTDTATGIAITTDIDNNTTATDSETSASCTETETTHSAATSTGSSETTIADEDAEKTTIADTETTESTVDNIEIAKSTTADIDNTVVVSAEITATNNTTINVGTVTTVTDTKTTTTHIKVSAVEDRTPNMSLDVTEAIKNSRREAEEEAVFQNMYSKGIFVFRARSQPRVMRPVRRSKWNKSLSVTMSFPLANLDKLYSRVSKLVPPSSLKPDTETTNKTATSVESTETTTADEEEAEKTTADIDIRKTTTADKETSQNTVADTLETAESTVDDKKIAKSTTADIDNTVVVSADRTINDKTMDKRNLGTTVSVPSASWNKLNSSVSKSVPPSSFKPDTDKRPSSAQTASNIRYTSPPMFEYKRTESVTKRSKTKMSSTKCTSSKNKLMLCGHCDKRSVAMFSCEDCFMNGCSECIYALHPKQTRYGNHLVLRSTTGLHCSAHDEPLRWYCVTCDHTLCAEGLASSGHAYHDVKKLEIHVNSQRNRLVDINRDVGSRCLDKAHVSLSVLDEEEEALRLGWIEQKGNIQQEFEKLKQTIAEKEDMMMREGQTYITSRLSDLQSLRHACGEIVVEEARLALETMDAVNGHSKLKFLELKTTIEEKIKTFQQQTKALQIVRATNPPAPFSLYEETKRFQHWTMPDIYHCSSIQPHQRGVYLYWSIHKPLRTHDLWDPPSSVLQPSTHMAYSVEVYEKLTSKGLLWKGVIGLDSVVFNEPGRYYLCSGKRYIVKVTPEYRTTTGHLRYETSLGKSCHILVLTSVEEPMNTSPDDSFIEVMSGIQRTGAYTWFESFEEARVRFFRIKRKIAAVMRDLGLDSDNIKKGNLAARRT